MNKSPLDVGVVILGEDGEAVRGGPGRDSTEADAPRDCVWDKPERERGEPGVDTRDVGESAFPGENGDVPAPKVAAAEGESVAPPPYAFVLYLGLAAVAAAVARKGLLSDAPCVVSKNVGLDCVRRMAATSGRTESAKEAACVATREGTTGACDHVVRGLCSLSGISRLGQREQENMGYTWRTLKGRATSACKTAAVILGTHRTLPHSLSSRRVWACLSDSTTRSLCASVCVCERECERVETYRIVWLPRVVYDAVM